MKKFLYLLVSFLVCPLCLHAVDYVTLKAGDVAVFGENATALLTFDYSKVAINGWTFDEYIDNEGGGEYKETWDKWIKAAEKQFVDEYNKKSTGLKVVRSKKIAVDYKMVLHVRAIETGNTAKGLLLPSFTLNQKKGAAGMQGTLEVQDNAGKTLCVCSLRGIYGTSGLDVASRLATLYKNISNKIWKFIGKELKSQPFGEEEEDEYVDGDDEGEEDSVEEDLEDEEEEDDVETDPEDDEEEEDEEYE